MINLNPSDSDFQDDKKSQKSFLEIIEDLAIRQKSNSPQNYAGQRTDLSSISINDYPEVESTEPDNLKRSKS